MTAYSRNVVKCYFQIESTTIMSLNMIFAPFEIYFYLKYIFVTREFLVIEQESYSNYLLDAAGIISSIC